MTGTSPASRPTPRRGRRPLLSSCAVAGALAALAGQPARAQTADAFNGSTGAFTRGSGTIVNDATALTPTTNINVRTQSTIIDWNLSGAALTADNDGRLPFMPGGSTANYNGSTPNFTVLNRIAGNAETNTRQILLNGSINSSSGGNIWFYSPGGIYVGATAQVNVGSLLLSTNVIDENSSLLGGTGNQVRFTGPAAGAAANAGIDVLGTISATATNAYVAVVAPRVNIASTAGVNVGQLATGTTGSAAYVAAEQATLTFAPTTGLFDVQVTVGSGVQGTTAGTAALNHAGATTGGAEQQRTYLVAVPKNDAITMLVGGTLNYAGRATVDGTAVVLSAGRDVVTAGGQSVIANTDSRGVGATAGNANILIDGVQVGANSVLANATGSVQLTGNNGFRRNLVLGGTMTGGVTLIGGRDASITQGAGTTTTIAGPLTLRAGTTTQGGTARLTLAAAGPTSAAGALSLANLLTIDAGAVGPTLAATTVDTGVNTAGGTAELLLSGNLTLNNTTGFTPRIVISAAATGGAGRLAGGSGTGGTARFVKGAGSLLLGGPPSISLDATGTGGAAAQTVVNPTTGVSETSYGIAGAGFGGGAVFTVNGDNNTATQDARFAGISIRADSIGGLGGSGGDAGGNPANQVSVTLSGAELEGGYGGGLDVGISATATGSNALNPSATARAGNAQGGTINVAVTNSQLNVQSGRLLVNADGLGGGGNGLGASGSATGGNATLTISGTTAQPAAARATLVAVSAEGSAGARVSGLRRGGAGGSGTGGTAAISVTTGTLSGAQGISALARGFGSMGADVEDGVAEQVAGAGGNARGGSASLTGTGATVSTAGTTDDLLGITVDGSAVAGTGGFAFGSDVGRSGGAGGSAQGGTATLAINAGTTVNAVATVVQAGGTGGEGGLATYSGDDAAIVARGGAGGAGSGGGAAAGTQGASLTIATGGRLNSQFNTVDATGSGGDGGIDDGAGAASIAGAGRGGVAQLLVNGGVLADNSQISVLAGATGGDGDGNGGGGNALGGTARLAFDNGSSFTYRNLAPITVNANSVGGSGASFGGTGGSADPALAPLAEVIVGGSANVRLFRDLNITANGIGGQGSDNASSGNAPDGTPILVGAGYGGIARLTARTGGTLGLLVDGMEGAGVLLLSAAGTGSNGATGGFARGGAVALTADGGSITFDGGPSTGTPFRLDAGASGGLARGGSGATRGGDAVGGSATVTLTTNLFSPSISATSLDVSTAATGGGASNNEGYFSSPDAGAALSGGNGAGGGVTVDVGSGLLSIAGGLNVTASGTGGNAAEGGGFGAGVGGTVTIGNRLIDAGSVNLGSLTVNAGGFGQNDDPVLGTIASTVPNIGGDGRGGNVTLAMVDGRFTAGSIAISVPGIASDGQVGATGTAGGSATGGTVVLRTVRGVFSDDLTIDARAQAGNGGDAGESGYGGGVQPVVAPFFAAAAAPSALGAGGTGGNATGGSVTIEADGAEMIVAGMSADLSATGGLGGAGLDAASGAGGAGGAGGSATGGTLTVRATGANGTVTLSGLSLTTDVTGGNGGEGGYGLTGGAGGAGGGATGATIALEANSGGLLDFGIDPISLSLLATGGSGGNGGAGSSTTATVAGGAGGNGGNATGASFRLTATGGSADFGDNPLNLSLVTRGGAGGIGGDGNLVPPPAQQPNQAPPPTPAGAGGVGGRGGDAANGTVDISVTGGTITVGDINVAETGYGGDGAQGGLGNGGTTFAAFGASGGSSLGRISLFAGDLRDGSESAYGQIVGGAATLRIDNMSFLPEGFAGDDSRIELRTDGVVNGAPSVISLASLDAAVESPDFYGVVALGAGSGQPDSNGQIAIADNAFLRANRLIELSATSDGAISAGLDFSASGGDITVRHDFRSGAAPTVAANNVFLSGGFVDAQFDSIVNAGDSLFVDAGFASLADVRAVNLVQARGFGGLFVGSATASAGATGGEGAGGEPGGGTVVLTAGDFGGGTYGQADVVIGGTVSAAGAVRVTAGGDVTVDGGGLVTSANRVTIAAGDDIVVRGAIAAATDPLADPAGGAGPGDDQTAGGLYLSAGALPLAYTPADGNVAAIVVDGGSLDAGQRLARLRAGAVQGGGAPITARSLVVEIANAPAPGAPQSDDGGQLSADCVQGNVCLGAITATELVSIGGAAGTEPTRLTIDSDVAANRLILRALGDVTLGDPGAARTYSGRDLLDVQSTTGAVVLRGPATLTGATTSGATFSVRAANGVQGAGATLQSGQDLGLFLGGGGIVVDRLITAGQINTLTAAGAVDIPGGLTAQGPVTVATLLRIENGPASIGATGPITVGTLEVAGGTSVNFESTGGAVSLGSAAASDLGTPNAVTLRGTSVAAGTIDATGDITLAASSGDVTATSLRTSGNNGSTTTGSIDISTPGAVALGDANAAIDVRIAAGGSVTTGALTAGDDVLVSGTTIELASARAAGETSETGYGADGGDIELLASTGFVRIGAGAAQRNATLTSAGGPISATSLTATGGTLLIDANGGAVTAGPTTPGAAVVASAGVDVIATGGRLSFGGAVTAGRDIDLIATSGATTLARGDAGGALLIDSAGQVSDFSALTAGTGRLRIRTDRGVTGGAVTSRGSDVTIFASDPVLLSGAAQAAGSLSINGATIDIASGTATGGDVALTTDGLIRTATLTAGDDVVLVGGTIDVGTATANGATEVGYGGFGGVGGNILATATDALRIGNGAARDNIRLASDAGPITSTSLAATRESVSAIATGGNVSLGSANAGVDIVARGGSGVTLANAATAGRDIILASEAGAVSSAALTATSGSVNVTAASAAVTGAIGAALDASVNGAGGVTINGDTRAGRALTLASSGGGVTARALRADGGSILANAGGGAVIVGDANAAGDVQLRGTGDVTAEDIMAARDIDLASSGGAVRTGGLTAGDDVRVVAASDILTGAIGARGAGADTPPGVVDLPGLGNVALTAGNSVRSDNVVAAGLFSATAGTGGIAIGDLDAGSISLSTTGDIALGAATTRLDFLVTTGRAFSANAITVPRDLIVDAGGFIGVGTATAGRDLGLNAGQELFLNSGTAGGDIALSGQSVVIDTILGTGLGEDRDMGSGGDGVGNVRITSRGSTVIRIADAAAVLAIDSEGDVGGTGGEGNIPGFELLRGGGAVTVNSRGAILGARIVSTGSAVALSAGGGVALDSVEAAAGIDLAQAATFSANSATAGGGVRLATSGPIFVGALSAGGDATALAEAGGIEIGSATAGAAFALGAGGEGSDITIGDTTAGSADFAAGGAITLTGSFATTGGDAVLQAVNAVSGGDVTAFGGFGARSTTGAVDFGAIAAGNPDSGGGIALAAATTVDTDALNAVGSITASAGAGPATIADVESSGGAVRVAAVGDIRVGNVRAAGSIFLTATGAVNGGNLTAGTGPLFAGEQMMGGGGTDPAMAGIAPGFDDFIVFDPSQPRGCDDCFTDAVGLPFAVNYFGNTYANTFVSNNGYLTFNTGQGDFTPQGLGAGYSGQPIIAAFFADVDTRNPDSSLATYGPGTFAGRQAFGATYQNVGYYDAQADKTNSFQIVLTNRADTGAGNFDIYYNYTDVRWETGSADGGINGFGGTPAAVGYNAGTGNQAGSFFELPGSRVPGSFLNGGRSALNTITNNGNPGQLLFTVRNGQVSMGGGTEPPSIHVTNVAAGNTAAVTLGNLSAEAVEVHGTGTVTVGNVSVADRGSGIAANGQPFATVLDAATSLRAGNIFSTGLIALGAGTGDLTAGTLQTAGSVIVLSDGTVQLGAINTGRGAADTLFISSPGVLATSGFSTFDFDSLLTGRRFDVATLATLDPVRGSTLFNLNTPVSTGNLIAAGNLVGIAAVDATNRIAITSTGTLTVARAVAGTTTELSSAAGDLWINGIVSGGRTVRTDAAGDILVAAAGQVRSDGAITMRSGDDIVVAAGGVIGTGAAAVRTPGSQSDVRVGGPADSVLLSAGALRTAASTDPAVIQLDGTVDGLAIELASQGVEIGGAARAGSSATQTLTFRNSGITRTLVGGDNAGAGYVLANAEIARATAGAIIVAAPDVAGTDPDVSVRALTLTGSAATAGNLVGDGGSFRIQTAGDVRVEGAVAIASAGANNLFGISGRRIEVVTPAASILFSGGTGNSPPGRIALTGDTILVGSAQAIADVGTLGTLDARDERLADADGLSDAGYVQAGALAFGVRSGLYIQNSGVNRTSEARRGFTAGSGGVSIATLGSNVEIVINGRQASSDGGFVTGRDLIPLLAITGQGTASMASFDPRSTANGCLIIGVSCRFDVAAPTFPVQDVIEQLVTPETDFDGETGLVRALQVPVIETAEFARILVAPVIEEPVTGAGNDDLWNTELVTGARNDDENPENQACSDADAAAGRCTK